MFESRRVPVIVPLSVKVSPARRAFKEMLGQNNHFLITIMVGLDAVAKGEARRGEDFSTTWDPKDVEQSARRSREFACKALTAWLTDSIAAYIRNLLAAPTIITDPKVAAAMIAAESFSGRILDIATACDKTANAETLLVLPIYPGVRNIQFTTSALRSDDTNRAVIATMTLVDPLAQVDLDIRPMLTVAFGSDKLVASNYIVHKTLDEILRYTAFVVDTLCNYL